MMEQARPRGQSLVRFLALLTLVILFLSLGKFFHFDAQYCQNFLGRFPLWLSALIFIVLCVSITTFIWVGPKDIFLIVAALLYGPYWSTLFVYIVEMTSLPIFFLLSRRLGRGYVEQKLRGGIKRLDETIAETSFWSIFFLRFFPVVPYRFLDLFMGLTKISLSKYFLIAAVGSPLRVFFLQFFLSLGLGTIMDINKFSAYLNGHPYVFVGVAVYVLGAFVMIYVMKKSAARKKKV